MKVKTIREIRRESLANDSGRAAGEAVLVRLATRLYALRSSMRLTQEQVAQRSGLDQAAISDIENGDANPTVRTVGRLAAGLGVDASVLLDHVPLGVQFGSAVILSERIKWQGASVHATTATGSTRHRVPHVQFRKVAPAAALDDKVHTA